MHFSCGESNFLASQTEINLLDRAQTTSIAWAFRQVVRPRLRSLIGEVRHRHLMLHLLTGTSVA